MSLAKDYSQAGELKFGQVGIANLRVRALDVDRLSAEMRERVERAPKLFERAAVVLDFGGLAKPPSEAETRALIDGLRNAGVLPVALAYGTREIDALSRQIDLPLLAKFRASYERTGAESAPAESAPEPAGSGAQPEPKVSAKPATEPAPNAAAPTSPGLVQTTPVRSGQQIYAEHRDLTVLATVGAGAEVLADGNIHIYGALRGRALAGAQGNEDARIFCREFRAELVAVAGRYKVLDDVPRDLVGKPVQVWLEQGQLKLAALD